MFGAPVRLNLDKRTRFKSLLGSFVSIISIFIITILCWNSKSLFFPSNSLADIHYINLLTLPLPLLVFVAFVNQDNIGVAKEIVYNENPKQITMSQDNLFFAIGIA